VLIGPFGVPQAVLSSFCLIVCAAASTDVMMWTKVAPGGGSPPPTNCHTATWINRKLFVVAGYSVPSSVTLTRVYDPDTLCWLSTGEYGRVPCQRYAHAAASVDNRFLYIFGGYSERYGWLNDMCMLDTGVVSGGLRMTLFSAVCMTPHGSLLCRVDDLVQSTSNGGVARTTCCTYLHCYWQGYLCVWRQRSHRRVQLAVGV
jgi:hypothetical protein